VTCAAVFDKYITLTWNAPVLPNGDIIQYIVIVLDTSGNEVAISNNTSTGTTFDVHGLQPGKSSTQYFGIFAVI